MLNRKNALFEAIAVMGKAFASPVRLELLDLLTQSPRTVLRLRPPSRPHTAGRGAGSAATRGGLARMAARQPGVKSQASRLSEQGGTDACHQLPMRL